ncbi:MAG: PHP domain-containing protein [Deltaproteobacteria bacterium]|nr:PHP domain-containing protein [Deltaproteobacteria bacterium]
MTGDMQSPNGRWSMVDGGRSEGQGRIPRLAARALVDLHVHSTASDGTDAPEDLPHLAKREGISVLALCDHDTVDGLERFEAGCRDAGIVGIAAAELSTTLAGRQLHVLAMGLSPAGRVHIREFLEGMRRRRNSRNVEMVEKLREHGVEIGMDELARVAGGLVVARPHFARILVDKGYVASLQEAFDRWLTPGCPTYVPKRKAMPEEVVEAIHEAGALAIAAHPNSLTGEGYDILQGLEELGRLPFDGVEVWHPNMKSEWSKVALGFARRRGLLVSGGSDYHGSFKEGIRLGCAAGGKGIFAGDVKDLLARLGHGP